MHRFLFFGLFLTVCLSNELYSQQRKIDSLLTVFQQETVDTLRADILLDISFEYRNSTPDSTIYYAREALSLSDELGYLPGEALALRNIGLGHQKKGAYDSSDTYLQRAIKRIGTARISALGDVYNTMGNTFYFRGDYDSAMYCFEKSAEIFGEFGERSNQAGNLANIGVIAETQGNYPRALEFYQRSLVIFEQEGSTRSVANVSSNMGSILEDQGKYQEALALYERALALDIENNDILGSAITLGEVAGIREHTGDTAGALEGYRESLRLFSKADARCRSGLALNNIGEIHLDLGQTDSAYYYFSSALHVADSCKIQVNVVTAQLNMGDYYLALNNSREAIRQFRAAFSLSDEMGLGPEKAEAAEQLYLLFKENNNLPEALKFLETHRQISDELFNEENTRKIERLQAAYEFEKEKELLVYEKLISDIEYESALATERNRKKYILIILGIFIVLVIVLTFMYSFRIRTARQLDRYNRDILGQKRQLQKVNQELVEMNDEKNTLISIVAHDLKNPVNQIRGLLQLIEIEGDQLPGNLGIYLDKMNDSSRRSVEMIDRVLDISAIENRKVDVKFEPTDLRILLEHSVEGFSTIAEEKNIKLAFTSSLQSAEIPTDPILLREVIDNLISNAIKFSPGQSAVTVALQKGDNAYTVEIRDEGPGISENDQRIMFNMYQQVSARPTGNEKSTGLGLAIVKKYLEELDYTIRCDSSTAGTIFSILIPDIEKF